MEKLHESDDQLELYALDRLSDTEIIRIEEHLMVCEACRERLEQTAAFAFAVQDVLRNHPEPAESTGRRWFGWLDFVMKPQFAVAAFAAIVLTAGVYWMAGKPGIGRTLTPVATLQLTAMRSDMLNMPAARELNLTLTDAPAKGSPFRIDVVDAGGSAIWSGAPQADSTGLSVHVPKAFPAGTYFVRLFDASGTLLHEYGLRAR